jgi:hypothetical protein
MSPEVVSLRGVASKPRGVSRTVWAVVNKGAVRTCIRCGKRYKKRIVIYSPSDFERCLGHE